MSTRARRTIVQHSAITAAVFGLLLVPGGPVALRLICLAVALTAAVLLGMALEARVIVQHANTRGLRIVPDDTQEDRSDEHA